MKVKRTTVTTVEVNDVKVGTYSLNIEQVKRLMAGETVQLQATLPEDVFDSIRLCEEAKKRRVE